jgi:hypothetical protein
METHIFRRGGFMHPRRRSLGGVAFAGALALIAVPALAQATSAPNAPPPPFLVASAVGEARIIPDRAMVSVAVETQGETAAAAASDNARLQSRIVEAVKAAGIAAAQIRTSGFNVYPEYSGGKTPKVTGYRTRNTVQIEVRNLGAVGNVIDAALGAGATNIGALSLYASSTDTTRREAVTRAVTKARAEAEAAAVAAGGSLGSLIELTIEPYGTPRRFESVVVTGAVMGAAPAPTPIETGELVVQAVIHAKWQFVSR